ncbi:hypothetical protein [Nonomuraea sp. MG754425]|uniref:hypothetical protein n=1 Tax=Nonomuraea sp. MG754425 TaxID=2570319 RepID=UPI001F368C24|nr:hypothetical protein [Nonomuraea sp. MG754425]
MAAGHRCVAPDLVGFGRSDKPADRFDRTYQAHLDWLRRTVRAIATNTLLPVGEPNEMGPFFANWLQMSQRSNPFTASATVARNLRAATADVDPRVLAAYDAPFPGEPYLPGARQFPLLVPLSPHDGASGPNRAAWAVLERLEIPFLCAYGEFDPVTRPHAETMSARIPGANGQPHATLEGAGHFLQEDRPAGTGRDHRRIYPENPVIRLHGGSPETSSRMPGRRHMAASHRRPRGLDAGAQRGTGIAYPSRPLTMLREMP